MSETAVLPRPHVRRACLEDADALALVGAATFLETYALTLPGPDIVTYCATKHTPTVYSQWLLSNENAVWLAEVGEGDTAVGLSVLTPPDLPGAEENDLELRRIYLLSRFQGFGIGREFIELAAAEAKARGARRLLLGVYGENRNALGFYAKSGFVEIGTRQFQVGRKLCFDFVLARSL